MAEIEDHTRADLYLATRRGVYAAQLGDDETQVFPFALWGMATTCLLSDEHGVLLAAGTRDQGVQARSAEGAYRRTSGIAGAEITALTREPRSGAAYAGTEPAALHRASEGDLAWIEAPSFRGPWAAAWLAQATRPARVSALCGLEGALYVSVYTGGVLRSSDGGRTFEPVSDGLPASVRALAGDRSAPQVIYAGTDAGLYRSEKSGYGWTRLALDPRRESITAIALCPGRPDLVLAGGAHAAVLAKPGTPAGADAVVYRSEDGGKHFVALSPERLPLVRGIFTGFVFDHKRPERIYAGASSGELFASIDGGRSWRLLAATIPGVLALAAGPSLVA